MTDNQKPVLKTLPVEKLTPGKYQPRQYFNKKLLEELSQSIRADGIVQPIVVRLIDDEQYEIIAGERRWRAAQLAHLSEVPCLIFEMSDQQAAAVTVVENIQRENLNPIEEAQAYQRLIDEFGYSHEALGHVVGKSRTKITNILRLLNLDSRVQTLLIEQSLSEGHGKVLLSMPLSEQYAFANQCVRYEWSVRELEKAVKRHMIVGKGSELSVSRDADIARLERTLSEYLGTHVLVEQDAGQSSGWLKIRYFDSDTFAGLLDKMGVVVE